MASSDHILIQEITICEQTFPHCMLSTRASVLAQSHPCAPLGSIGQAKSGRRINKFSLHLMAEIPSEEYRGPGKGMHVLLSNSQAGPGRNFSQTCASLFRGLCTFHTATLHPLPLRTDWTLWSVRAETKSAAAEFDVETIGATHTQTAGSHSMDS